MALTLIVTVTSDSHWGESRSVRKLKRDAPFGRSDSH